MRKLGWIILSLGLCGGFAAATRADTFQLIDGTSVSGDIVLFNEAGVTLRTPSDSYTNVVWPKFSQASLKQLAQNPKIKPLAEAFIETPPARPKNEEIQIQDVSRLALPPKESLFAALLSSSVGFVVLLLIYAANVYAGYEIAIVRGRPIGLVMVVAAVLPIFGRSSFFACRYRRKPRPRGSNPRSNNPRLWCRAGRQRRAARPRAEFKLPGRPRPGGRRIRRPRFSSAASSCSTAGFLKRNFPVFSA